MSNDIAMTERSSSFSDKNGAPAQQRTPGSNVDIDELIASVGQKNYVYFNWLTYCKEAGSAAAKESMLAHLTSPIGSGFYLAGVQTPPERPGEDFQHSHWETQLYVIMASLAFTLVLITVMLVVTIYAYGSLYTDEEFPQFIAQFGILAATVPPTLTGVSACAGMVAVTLRIEIVYGSPAWIIFACTSGALMLILLIFIFPIMERAVTKTRKRRHNPAGN